MYPPLAVGSQIVIFSTPPRSGSLLNLKVHGGHVMMQDGYTDQNKQYKKKHQTCVDNDRAPISKSTHCSHSKSSYTKSWHNLNLPYLRCLKTDFAQRPFLDDQLCQTQIFIRFASATETEIIAVATHPWPEKGRSLLELSGIGPPHQPMPLAFT